MLSMLLVFSQSFAFSASPPNLKQILSIKPTDDIATLKKQIQGLKTADVLKDGAYEVEVEGKKVKSVKVDFMTPVASETLVTGNTKGFCLVQSMSGDIALNRLFFFNMQNKSRYEITPDGKIKSVLIQDIPGASENRPCLFSELKI